MIEGEKGHENLGEGIVSWFVVGERGNLMRWRGIRPNREEIIAEATPKRSRGKCDLESRWESQPLEKRRKLRSTEIERKGGGTIWVHVMNLFP